MNKWKKEREKEEFIAREMVKPLIEAMENGGGKWQEAWNWWDLPQYNVFTGQAYTGSNSFYLRLHQVNRNFKVGQWLTEYQANIFGWEPKPNVYSYLIIYPFRCGSVYEVTDPASGEVKKDWLGNSIKRGYSPETYEVAFVFNISQLKEGPNSKKRISDVIAQFDKPMQSDKSDEKRTSQVKEICEAWGRKQSKTYLSCSNASYCKAHDEIRTPPLQSFTTIDDFYSTWLHEIIHSTGHPLRLGRMSFWYWGNDKYAREELVAELGNFLMCQKLGLRTKLSQHAAYLSYWSECLKETPSIILKVLKEANEANWMIQRNVGLPAKRKTPAQRSTIRKPDFEGGQINWQESFSKFPVRTKSNIKKKSLYLAQT
jgi:antirestriction protein ArdC